MYTTLIITILLFLCIICIFNVYKSDVFKFPPPQKNVSKRASIFNSPGSVFTWPFGRHGSDRGAKLDSVHAWDWGGGHYKSTVGGGNSIYFLEFSPLFWGDDPI